MPPTVIEHNADALDILRRMPTASVDAVITDPPYGIDFQSGHPPKSKRRPKIANDAAPFTWWLHDAARVLKPDSALVCFCRWDTAEAFRQAITHAGLRVRAQLVWDRVVHGLGDTATCPGPQHDLMWFAAKGRYTFTGPRPTSVLRHQRLLHPVHPNEKPLSLMQQLVRDYSRPGGTVLDPFQGSGNTGVACVKEGRNYIGIELDQGYAKLADARIAGALLDIYTEYEAA